MANETSESNLQFQSVQHLRKWKMCCIYNGIEVAVKTKPAPVLDVRLHVTHHFINSIRTAFISMSWQYLALNCEEEFLPASTSIVTATKSCHKNCPPLFFSCCLVKTASIQGKKRQKLNLPDISEGDCIACSLPLVPLSNQFCLRKLSSLTFLL